MRIMLLTMQIIVMDADCHDDAFLLRELAGQRLWLAIHGFLLQDYPEKYRLETKQGYESFMHRTLFNSIRQLINTLPLNHVLGYILKTIKLNVHFNSKFNATRLYIDLHLDGPESNTHFIFCPSESSTGVR